MTVLAFLRHGKTVWNAERRVQGHRDIPLSDEGRAALDGMRPPVSLRKATWFVSPLTRARETATLLGVEAQVAPDLIEMNWGDWEGRTVAELRAADPEGMRANEDKGLDFRPQGGESPREVQARVLAWARMAADAATADTPIGAITHKGVLRAMIALALDWDMRPPDPVKLNWDCAHLLELSPDGGLRVAELNVPLLAQGEGS